MEAQNRSPSSQVCKRLIPQLLLSISLCSFAYSFSSLYKPPFTFFPYFSLNKNCLFLICNGLLVLLTKTSGFILPQDGPQNDINASCLLDRLEPLILLEGAGGYSESNQGNNQVSIFIRDEEKDDDHLMMDAQGDPRGLWVSGNDHEQGNFEESGEETGDQGDEELSTEELNRKFEDFIRRMRKEL